MSDPRPWPTTVPTLTDGVVTLRALGPEDVEAVFEQCQDPEMQRWTTIPTPYERANAEYFVGEAVPLGWENPMGAKGFAIEALDVGRPRFAGSIDLRPDGQAGAEVGYALAPWARGRGIAARALRVLLRWAFERLGVEAVSWRAQVGNWASRRVAWSCGFRVEGAVRGLLEARGERQDAWVGSLLRGEPMAPRRPWLVAPEIHGQRVNLRPWRDTDLVRAVESCSDPVAQRWLQRLPSPYGLQDAVTFVLGVRTRLAEGAAIGWSLADPVDDRPLGSLDLFGLDRHSDEAEVGYLLHPDARGRGVMTEAVRLAVRHAVLPEEDGGLGLRRLSLRAATRNTASRRVAEAAGFREVGVQREVGLQPDGSADDLTCYDLLAREVLGRGVTTG